MIILGREAITSFSGILKLNVRSSTDVELIGVDNAMPSILWKKYFIEAQGYSMEHNVLHQDNKSIIILAKIKF